MRLMTFLLPTVLQAGTKGTGFFVDPFVDACLFLEEVQLKDALEKDVFFKKVAGPHTTKVLRKMG